LKFEEAGIVPTDFLSRTELTGTQEMLPGTFIKPCKNSEKERPMRREGNFLEPDCGATGSNMLSVKSYVVLERGNPWYWYQAHLVLVPANWH